MRIVPLVLLAIIALYHTTQPDLSTEAAVQAAVIDNFFVQQTTQRVVVGDSTVAGGSHFVDGDYRSALRILGKLPEGLQGDFEAKRSVTRQVDSLPTKVPMQRFTAADRAAMRAQDDPTSYWNEFYRRYPASSGLIQVSSVGFSRDGTSALVLIEYGCGGRCGGTKYVLLTKESGRWRVTRTAQPRIS